MELEGDSEISFDLAVRQTNMEYIRIFPTSENLKNRVFHVYAFLQFLQYYHTY